MFLRSIVPEFTRHRLPGRVLMAASLPLLLTSCGESSRLKAETQTLQTQRLEIEQQASAYGQHIEYYRKIIPGANAIAGSTDPGYAELAESQARLDEEMETLTNQVASLHTHLNVLREECSREHQLNNAQ